MADETDLAGRLLVASPSLGDPNFARAVVLVLQHDDEGAMGVVVNRATAVPVGDVLPPWSDLVTTPPVLFQGGPVGLDSALALGRVTSGDDPIGWRRVDGTVGLVDLDTPTELITGVFDAFRVFAGYAGWGTGQLENEIAEGSWYVVDALDDDAFYPPAHNLWRTVLRRQGGELALVSTYPIDPSLN